MNAIKTFFRMLCFLGLLGVLSSCASVHPASGFLGNDTRLREGLYFKQEFTDPKADLSKYDNVKINPVNLEYFDREAKFKMEPGELERLASVLQTELTNQLENRYRILSPKEKPDSKTLAVDPALVYRKSPYRVINIITTVLILAPVSAGSAAVEIKLSDGRSGKVIAQMAEKRTSNKDFKSLVIGPFMKYQNAEAIFRKWSENLLMFLET